MFGMVTTVNDVVLNIGNTLRVISSAHITRKKKVCKGMIP